MGGVSGFIRERRAHCVLLEQVPAASVRVFLGRAVP